MHIESAGKLFLESGQLPGEVWTCQKRFPHLGKGSHNKDCHLDRTWAVQHIRSHDGTMLSENIGTAAAASVAQT
jgi:hypothetical protein